MDRDIGNQLRSHRDEILQRFSVQRLGLFGSAARNQLNPDSDVDVLVEFRGTPTFDSFMGLKLYLEDLLGRHVDLVTPDCIKPRMLPLIEKDLLRVA